MDISLFWRGSPGPIAPPGADVRILAPVALARAAAALVTRLREHTALVLGRRLARCWRRSSVTEAGDGFRTWVSLHDRSGRGAEIITAHTEGAVITAGNGRWLALATAAVPRTGGRSGGRRMTPAEVGRRFPDRLVFRPGRSGRTAVLVLMPPAAPVSGGRGRSVSPRPRGTVYFVLTPQVTLKKRLDPDSVVARFIQDFPDIEVGHGDQSP